MAVHLTLHTQPAVPLEAESLTPDRFVGLSESGVAGLPVMHGNQSATVGDFFNVANSKTTQITIEGDLTRVKRIGEGMTQGQLLVEGNVGMHVGAGMRGGELVVEGNASDWAGAQMKGGRLIIKGNAGDLVGAAYRGARTGMQGGEIIVHGHAGAEIGNYMRRGLIAIGSNSGDFSGVHMLAGTIIVLGKMGWRAGAGMKRGTLVSMQPARLLPTFNFDCRYRPTFLRLYLQHLRALRLPITDAQIAGEYHRWSGDMVELGRGEILSMV